MKRGGPLKRTRLRRVGARAEREREALAAFREAVLARAGGVCESCGERRRLEAHHHARNPRVHDPALGSGLCATCHRGVHDHTLPNWREYLA